MLIKESNKEKINKMIKEAEGKARERCITYDDIVYGIRKIERRLDIPKCHMVGIKAYVDHYAQNFPKAYKYRPYSTHYAITRKKTGWDLTSVYRDDTRKYGHTYKLVLTNDASEEILKNIKEF